MVICAIVGNKPVFMRKVLQFSNKRDYEVMLNKTLVEKKEIGFLIYE